MKTIPNILAFSLLTACPPNDIEKNEDPCQEIIVNTQNGLTAIYGNVPPETSFIIDGKETKVGPLVDKVIKITTSTKQALLGNCDLLTLINDRDKARK